MQATIIIGQRHLRDDGQPCFCGCHWVQGRTGTIVEDADTPRLAASGIFYAAFERTEVDGVGRGPVTIAYSYAELGLPVPSADPERHESMRLFTPAPNQIPGQLSL